MARPYLVLPLAGGDIRTLTLQPSERHDDPLVCLLDVTHLDHPSPYEALSYTWGPPFEGQTLATHTIQLCGHEFEVTGNLHAALKRFRLRDAPRTLWVDAICIDQSNDAERGVQVGIMSQVYAAASRVLIWLGQDSESRDGLVTLRTLDHLASVVTEWDIVQAIMSSRNKSRQKAHYYDVVSRLLPPDLDFGTPSALPPAPSLEDLRYAYVLSVVEAIHRFFTRRYFRRLWVVQEMFHAKNGIFYCGSESLYWQRFQRGFDRLRKAGSSLLLEGISRRVSLDVLQGTLVERVGSLFRWSKKRGFFLKCIEQCNGTHCQDPRDRIFALSSMNSPHWKPYPNYSLSVSEVFTQFSQSCVENGHVQSLLHYAARQQADTAKRSSREELQPPLPSWVIDWRNPGEIGTSFWPDWVSENGPSLEALIDDSNRLTCTLGTLCTVLDENPRSSERSSEAVDKEHDLAVKSVWSSMSASCGDHLQAGDVLCRIPTRVESALDEADGLTVPLKVCARPGPQLCEDGILVLRPVRPALEEFMLVPLDDRARWTHRQLRTIPNDRGWRRFCIV